MTSSLSAIELVFVTMCSHRGFRRTRSLTSFSPATMLSILLFAWYELAAALARRSDGIFALGQGTLYPLLYSLEKKGLIEVGREEEVRGSGRRRRYYRLTRAGRAELEAGVATWKDIARGMRLVLGGPNA